MTITATQQLLQDGKRNCSMLFTGVSDGGGGDEVLAVKVDPTLLTPACRRLAILSVDWDVQGGNVRVYWDDLTPDEILDCATHGNFDFCSIGGLQNFTDPDASGRLLFTTEGFDVGSSYMIHMRFKKKYVWHDVFGAEQSQFTQVP